MRMLCLRPTATRRQLYEPPAGSCVLGTEMERSGRSFRMDHCTTCACLNGTVLCRTASCPPLDCPVEQQVKVANQCCAQCTPTLEMKAACTVGGQTYQVRTVRLKDTRRFFLLKNTRQVSISGKSFRRC